MSPAFDKRVAAENFFDLARGRRVQVQELHVVTGVGFVDRRNVRRVIIESGEPFLLLFVRPIVLRGSDVVIRFSGALFERTRRVHRCKRRGAQILRSLFSFRANIRGDTDQMMAQNVLPDFVQIFGYVRDEILRCRMFPLDLLEAFNRRLFGILMASSTYGLGSTSLRFVRPAIRIFGICDSMATRLRTRSSRGAKFLLM